MFLPWGFVFKEDQPDIRDERGNPLERWLSPWKRPYWWETERVTVHSARGSHDIGRMMDHPLDGNTYLFWRIFSVFMRSEHCIQQNSM